MDFEEAVSRIMSTNADNETQLELYGLYKTATVGKCNGQKPGIFDFTGKLKYEAWKKYEELSVQEAKAKYVELVETLLNIPNKIAVSGGWISVSQMEKPPLENNMFEYAKQGLIGKLKPQDLYQKDQNGMNIIHWAADHGKIQVLEEFLVDELIDLADNDGNTALYLAKMAENEDICDYLISRGAKKDILNNDNLMFDQL